MILDLLLIIFGCVLLYYGAEWLVAGATVIAEYFRIPKSIAGLTLVALGTSAPELFVNLLSASSGHTKFAMSNIAGSNLANLCLGFGCCAIIGTLVVSRKTFRIDLSFFVLTPLIVVIGLFLPEPNFLPLATSAILTLILVAYFISVIRRSQEETDAETVADKPPPRRGFLQLIGGSLLLYGGAELVLKTSTAFAQNLGISEAIIGLTIVAAGTSIPDISASIVAIRHKENDLAVGNILGSNISNIAFVLNATLLVSWGGLPTSNMGTMDYVAVLVVSGSFMAMLWLRETVTKGVGIGLIAVYVAFIGWRIVNIETPNPPSAEPAETALSRMHETQVQGGVATIQQIALLD